VFLQFVSVENPLINVERVRTRVELGGHSVPEDRIVARYSRTMSLLPEILLRVDRAWIFDNSEWLTGPATFGGRLVATARRSEGRIEIAQRFPTPAWVRQYLLEPARLRGKQFKITVDGGQPRNESDRLVVRNGVRCAGVHLVVELYEAEHLDDIDVVEDALHRCVHAAGATLLHLHVHQFGPNGGISGVAVLHSFHISVHTLPGAGYAALDVFMGDGAKPEACIPVFRELFRPKRIVMGEHLRGQGA
jgi:S-adenosylmethionine decarboxylase